MLLNGPWTLYYAPQGQYTPAPSDDLAALGIPSVAATVPGNTQLDLSAAGILPSDLFKGENILAAEEYETYEWWYETTFAAPNAPGNQEKAMLHFHGVDCFADYYLNGEKFGESDNMMIGHDFDVTNLLCYGKENTLRVHIKSPVIQGASYDMEPNMLSYSWQDGYVGLYVRRAPHSYGWDIMPRAITSGIWRDVELSYVPIYDFKFLYVNLDGMDGTTGKASLLFDAKIPPEYSFKALTYTIRGRCEESTFQHTISHKGGCGRIPFEIPGVKLWWPRPYGEPNLYDITVEVRTPDDKILLTRDICRGFRTVTLKHSDIVEKDGGFEFIVNGVRIMAVGSNWVPMDAFHSRDKARYAKALELADDVGCNILRCWGGNVYEDQEFFDFCDRHGIMVWQDFAMACHYYPQNEFFMKLLSKEAEWVVAALRDHPSLVVWSGDNEIDSMLAGKGVDPSVNHLTREVLPRITERLDPYRPYIASSPYISPKAFSMGDNAQGSKVYPEDHLWGPRDYFKSSFYTGSNAYFVSETGYHGCPAKSSIEKFIDPEYVWPYFDNKQWNLHSSDQKNSPHRVMLMHNQVKQLFGEVPTDMEDYIFASQISQAEAKKFFIERMRANMSYGGGVIWWNLMDGWPQMSDAVVDYYYEKKLAYDYIKRSSKPFILLLGEMIAWGQPILTANSTQHEVKGHATITDLSTDKVVWESDFIAPANANTTLGKLDLMYSDKTMFLLEWTTDEGEKGFNTYLTGSPAYDLATYKTWFSKIEAKKAILG
ncbi:MAG: glycoside hydrolase family 2 [Ruminococcaceae bacterium]|nr:glycoside hydrolase family 2 [Oscillospiraceae bacterium]